MKRSTTPATGGSLALLAVIVLAAFNMRPALTSVATVVDQIAAAYQLRDGPIGVLTMLPPFCLGVAGMFASRFGRDWRADHAVLAGLLLLMLGLMARTVPLAFLLYLGTILASFGIGLAGVFLPVVIKRDFSFSVGIATGLYTMALCVGGATAAASSRMLQGYLDLDWRGSVGVWVIPAALSALAWWWAGMPNTREVKAQIAPTPTRLWSSPVAWSVTLFMSFQSGLAFVVFGWLPAILQDRGMPPVAAGYVTSFSIMGQLITALAVPAIAARMRSQRMPMVACLGATAAGLTGTMLGSPSDSAWWGFLLGLGQGGTFGLALLFIGLRSANATAAMALSSMAQGVGYMIAASVPMATGIVRQWTLNETGQLSLFLAILLLALLSGWKASSGEAGNRVH